MSVTQATNQSQEDSSYVSLEPNRAARADIFSCSRQRGFWRSLDRLSRARCEYTIELPIVREVESVPAPVMRSSTAAPINLPIG
jgi:hypothetical protein